MFQVKSVVNDYVFKNNVNELKLKCDKVYDVYTVEKAGCDAVFLIYGEDKSWHWVLADCFVPLEDSMDENWWD